MRKTLSWMIACAVLLLASACLRETHSPTHHSAPIDRADVTVLRIHETAFVNGPHALFDKEATANTDCTMQTAQQHSIIRYTFFTSVFEPYRVIDCDVFEFSSPFIVKPSLPIALRQLLI
jgi:hypothetical protein